MEHIPDDLMSAIFEFLPNQDVVAATSVSKSIGLSATQVLRQVIKLAYHDITDSGLASLATLTRLMSLNISCCDMITDSGLASLALIPSLTSLNISCCGMITDTGLESLATLTRLTSLYLYGCRNITDTGLEGLALTTSLTSLKMA